MFRDKKGRFTTQPEETKEMTEEQKEAICYKSKLLNKYFDNYDDLVKEETALKEEEAKKKAVAEAKKAEASKVELAFKNLNATKRDYNDVVTEAKKAYMQVVADAKKAYEDSVKDITTKLEEAEKTYNEALNEFTKAHPEGYHVTLKDGDNVTTISRSGNADLFGTFNDFFNYMFRKF